MRWVDEWAVGVVDGAAKKALVGVEIRGGRGSGRLGCKVHLNGGSW